jgi:molybdenum cofactor synthesis domain-containing protein
MSERIWTAALLVIGDEILSGRTHDRNIAQVAGWLQVQGIRLMEVRVVPDVAERIAEAVSALRTAHDYLFTTGGIGPTHDDITVDAVAEALGLEVVVHPEARRILEDYYATRGGLTEARLRMARVPAGADLIPNRMSGAPGIRIGNVHLMAGVPHICAQMLDALKCGRRCGPGVQLHPDSVRGRGRLPGEERRPGLHPSPPATLYGDCR